MRLRIRTNIVLKKLRQFAPEAVLPDVGKFPYSREIQPRFGRREGIFRNFTFVGNFQASNENSVM